MKRNVHKINVTLKYSIAFLLMLFSCALQGQVDEEAQDSIKKGADLGKITIPNPILMMQQPIDTFIPIR